MPLGPIEVLVVKFPGSRFSGGILPELQRLVEAEIISVVDGLFIQKDADGELRFAEFEELDANEDASALAAMLDQLDSLVSSDDVDELGAALEPNSSGAILVFEHTWAKPLRDAVVESGGVLAANFRVPGRAVDALLADLAGAN
jgi:hypothetical protein